MAFSPISGVLAVHGSKSRTLDDRNVVAGKLVLVEQLAHFHLDELEKLLVVDLIDLVQEHDQRGHADLTGQQNVLAGLGHGAVRCRTDQNAAVHLRGTGDHVLHVVGVARAIDVGVVTVFRLVFHMRRGDRDPARLLFRRTVDLVIGLEVTEILRDRRRQRRLAVVNVTNRADVAMRLVTFKLCLSHGLAPSSLKSLSLTRISRRPHRQLPEAPARSGRMSSCTGRGPGSWSAGCPRI